MFTSSTVNDDELLPRADVVERLDGRLLVRFVDELALGKAPELGENLSKRPIVIVERVVFLCSAPWPLPAGRRVRPAPRANR